MTSSKTLAIILDMSDGSTRKLTIQQPTDGVDLDDVNDFVTAAITAGMFNVNGATVQGTVRAYIDEHTITELE